MKILNVEFFIYNAFFEGYAKVRDHCHITGKYRGAAHKDCHINISLNYKIPTVFHSLKNYDAHVIMQEIGKCDFKINVISSGLEKYLSFSLNNKLVFIDSFQFLSSSLDTLAKHFGENDFKYWSQAFDSEVLDLVKKKKIILSLAKTSFIVH